MIKDGNWKMNPPLRCEKDRLETIKALLDGTATVIASDHAPHTEMEKSQEYDKCPNGIIGLETMIPLVYTNLIKTGLATYQDMLNWLVFNPINIFNLPKRSLEVGYPADIAVLDIQNEREYRTKIRRTAYNVWNLAHRRTAAAVQNVLRESDQMEQSDESDDDYRGVGCLQ
jgi:dihydroorotase